MTKKKKREFVSVMFRIRPGALGQLDRWCKKAGCSREWGIRWLLQEATGGRGVDRPPGLSSGRATKPKPNREEPAPRVDTHKGNL